jgi:hypothetical protein
MQRSALHLLSYTNSVSITISELLLAFALARVLKEIILNRLCLLLKTARIWVNTWLAVLLVIVAT